MLTSEKITDFLSFLRNIETNLSIARQNAEEAEKESQDIFHAVEFGRYNTRRTATVVKKLQVVRKRRRVAKETVEVLEPIEAWIGENKAVIKSLERLLGEIRKIENKQKTRMYAPRTDVMKGLEKQRENRKEKENGR